MCSKFIISKGASRTLSKIYDAAFSRIWLMAEGYGIRLSHMFEIRSISNEKSSISTEKPSISIKKLGISNRKFRNTRFFTL